MSVSPSKRRVLAALDVNVSSPGSKTNIIQPGGKPGTLATTPTIKASAAPSSSLLSNLLPRSQRQAPGPVLHHAEQQPRKRSYASLVDESTASPSAREQPKKPCPAQQVEAKREMSSPQAESDDVTKRDQERHRSASPDTSSVFDTSGMDTSQATALTEPDIDAHPPPHPILAGNAGLFPGIGGVIAGPRRPPPTLEESRQKLEVVRLRLKLATYKLLTGQTDIPLERLQVRPIPPSSAGKLTTAGGDSGGDSSFSGLSTASASASFSSTTSSSRHVPSQSQSQSQIPQHSRGGSSTATQLRANPTTTTAQRRLPMMIPSSSSAMVASDSEDDEYDSEYNDARRRRRLLAAAAAVAIAATATATASPPRSRPVNDVAPPLPAAATPATRSPVKRSLLVAAAAAATLPPLSAASAAVTPQSRRVREEDDAERLTSSALRGGAASGLLELRNSQ